MKTPERTLLSTTFLTILLPIALSGCSNISIWPWDNDNPAQAGGGRTPENSKEYRCEGNRVFHLRYLNEGKTAWVILPERQIALDRSSTGNTFTNGIAVLKIDDAGTTLTDGPAIAYKDCKPKAQ